MLKRILSGLLALTLLASLGAVAAFAEEPDAENLVYQNGTLDGILGEGETEKVLTIDWLVSYPVATFGNATADSPAKVKDIDGNAVLVLEHSSGDFASFFADLSQSHDGPVPAGTYELSMDLKPVGDDFTTDNVGYNLYSQYNDIRIWDQGWQNCTELSDGWLLYEVEHDINAASVDSIQMWFNTMGKSTLYVDNLSFKPVADVPSAPEDAITVEYTIGSGETIAIPLPQTGATVTIEEKAGYVLEEGLDYALADGTVILKNDYADGLAAGANALLIKIDDAAYPVDLVIRQGKPAIPENKDAFLMQETLVGGDFDMFDTGFAFSLEQVEGWGSNVSYDDPGVIVDLDGNKALRLQKDKKSSYSSAFAFMSPTIQAGDTLTLSFDYRLDAKDMSIYQGADINFCFVSASNMQMCLIPLDKTNAPQTRGDGDYQWDVQYQDLGEGWTRVTMDFVANNALLSYNSMRFLLPTDKAQEGDAMYVDNVSLVLWAQAEAPVYGGGELSFDKAKPADVFAMVDLQALDPQSISLNGTAVDAKYWSVNPAKDTITLSKDYLATLENGEQTFTVKTAGGECSFQVSITGQAAAQQAGGEDAPNDTWIWIVAGGVALLAIVAAVVIVLKKKK